MLVDQSLMSNLGGGGELGHRRTWRRDFDVVLQDTQHIYPIKQTRHRPSRPTSIRLKMLVHRLQRWHWVITQTYLQACLGK